MDPLIIVTLAMAALNLYRFLRRQPKQAGEHPATRARREARKPAYLLYCLAWFSVSGWVYSEHVVFIILTILLFVLGTVILLRSARASMNAVLEDAVFEETQLPVEQTEEVAPATDEDQRDKP